MGIDASAVARVVGIDTQFKDLRAGGVLFLPQRIAVIAQGATASTYSTDKKQITSAAEAGSTYGYGSPIHLIMRQLFPQNGDGVGTIPVTVYPLVDDGSGVAAAGSITPVGSQTKQSSYRVRINNILSEAFVLDVGDGVAQAVAKLTTAINAVLEQPVTAVDNASASCDLTAKWKGVSGNDIHVEVLGEDNGITFTISQPAGGLVNPSISDALSKVGDVWETMILNGLDIADTTALDALKTFGEGRWGQLTRKPMVAFTGVTAAAVAAATTVSAARTDDRVNAQLVSPGSNDLPFVVAARQLARIAKVANNNPPRDYGSQRATGLVPGDDGDQWDYAERDQAVKAGSSTVVVKDGVVNIGDVVTFYAPAGDPTPAYRYVVDIVKLQNIIFNLDLIFNSAEWDGAPLIPDGQPTVNRDARTPSAAKSAAAAMLDSLGLNAIISDPKGAKEATVAEIDAGNPKRLNLRTTVKLAGNANIISVDLYFGFYFGSAAAA